MEASYHSITDEPTQLVARRSAGSVLILNEQDDSVIYVGGSEEQVTAIEGEYTPSDQCFPLAAGAAISIDLASSDEVWLVAPEGNTCDCRVLT